MTAAASAVAAASAASSPEAQVRLFELAVIAPLEVRVFASTTITLLAILLFCLFVAWKTLRHWHYFRTFEINEAEIGVGGGKLKLSPNEVDRQIAYKIWVELSTRKIGLKIDLEHDVISEVYDSWHTFFTVTRELVKDVPVNKFRRADTKKIVGLSIGVLNDGLRPHLTAWQARFRRWNEQALKGTDLGAHSPQEIQKQFPKFDELQKDLLAVNERLMAYRKMMYELVVSK